MRGTQKNYYKILGIDEHASLDEIKLRYRLLSKKYHPDRAEGDERKMSLINEAYATLSDPLKRHAYIPPSTQQPSTASAHSPVSQTRQATDSEQEPSNGWAIFFAYVLAIPIAILLVTLLTPVANRIFTKATTNTITPPGNVAPLQQAPRLENSDAVAPMSNPRENQRQTLR